MKMLAAAVLFFTTLTLVFVPGVGIAQQEELLLLEFSSAPMKMEAEFFRDLDKAIEGGCGAFQWYLGWEKYAPPTIACRVSPESVDELTRAIVEAGGT